MNRSFSSAVSWRGQPRPHADSSLLLWSWSISPRTRLAISWVSWWSSRVTASSPFCWDLYAAAQPHLGDFPSACGNAWGLKVDKASHLLLIPPRARRGGKQVDSCTTAVIVGAFLVAWFIVWMLLVIIVLEALSFGKITAGSCDMGISSRMHLKHYSTFVILPGGKELWDLNVLNQFEDVEAWARCCALIHLHWPFLFLFTNFIGSSTLIISAPVTHILIDLLNIYSAFFFPFVTHYFMSLIFNTH